MRAGAVTGTSRSQARPRSASGGPSRARGIRRAVVVVACAAAVLAAAYLAWFRDSSLVRVERTAVTGLTTSDAPEIRAALTDAAAGMTTLHVDVAALEQAVSRYPEVAGLDVDPGFPDELQVRVLERRPVASVAGAGDARLAVAADGTLLPSAEPERSLAQLPSRGSAPAGRVEHPRTLAALEVAAAAPPALARRVVTVRQLPSDGFVVELRGGPVLLLGNGARLEAKWLAAATVLARRGAAGAHAIDVTLPERPAVEG